MHILDKVSSRTSIWGTGFSPRLLTARRGAWSTRSAHCAQTAVSSPNIVRMDQALEGTITAIHGTPSKAVLYVTGGGSQALAWLLAVPGASNTVLEAIVPYAQHSLTDLLGQEPAQYCSENTAVQMAVAAYRRAAKVSSFASGPLLGVAATCGLATVAVKRGEHRAFLAVHGASGTSTLSLHLAKGLRSRSQEEALVSQALVKMLAEASGVDASALLLPLVSSPSQPPPQQLILDRSAASASGQPGAAGTGVSIDASADASATTAGALAATTVESSGFSSFDRVSSAGPPGSARPSWQGEAQRPSVGSRSGSSSNIAAGLGADAERASFTRTSRNHLPSIPDNQQLTSFPELSLQSTDGAVSGQNNTGTSASSSPAATAAAAPSPPTTSAASAPPSAAVAEGREAATGTSSSTAVLTGSSWREGVTHDGWRLGHLPCGDALEALLAGRVRCVEYAHGQVVVDAPRSRRLYLPGSFNPLHEGHKQLLAAAQAAAGASWEAGFELTISNPDKGTLSYEEVARRVQQFTASGLPLLLTKASLFTLKAQLLPHCKFVIGYDTAVRLLMPKYYGNSETQMVLDFSGLHHQRCSFIVAGRLDSASSKFLTMNDVEVPEQMRGWNLFQGLSEQQFRADISSTQLRNAAAQQAQT